MRPSGRIRNKLPLSSWNDQSGEPHATPDDTTPTSSSSVSPCFRGPGPSILRPHAGLAAIAKPEVLSAEIETVSFSASSRSNGVGRQTGGRHDRNRWVYWTRAPIAHRRNDHAAWIHDRTCP